MIEDTQVNDSTEIPTDAAVTAVDLYPINIELIPESEQAEEILRIQNANFEELTVATDAPSDVDAQTALVRFTEGRLTDVIINQK